MEYTTTGFYITALIAISGCLWWLVKKIISITTTVVKENTEAFKELKFAIRENSVATQNNITATNELKQAINNKL